MQGAPNPNLARCPDCGFPISTTARHCPRCGAEWPNPNPPDFGRVFKVTLYVVFSLLAISAVLSVISAVVGIVVGGMLATAFGHR